MLSNMKWRMGAMAFLAGITGSEQARRAVAEADRAWAAAAEARDVEASANAMCGCDQKRVPLLPRCFFGR